ncbi:Aldolase-II domain-containing protein [Mycena chlorophos]|uniref:Carboxylic ester hydrolase n=1 Tax=Mycena chlorophos TaxID=658473 RepID=A0A8H6VVR4_MYCCL|nr:Aldolase-II domain-containing protein [Mycena chlorophos]
MEAADALTMVLSKIALALLPSLLASAANVVDLGYASYAGNLSFPNTVAYLGLPYAEPPLGNLRFRAPVVLNTARVAKETGGKVVDASQYPNFCIQGSTGAGDAGGAGSEDCLKVNVYAPAGAKRGDDLPVLVYIHGGGYFYGNPANWPFDGWVHQSPNVVIVSVYYRLDAFGFLSHPDFTDPKIGDFNAGFLDQTMALEWIQAHIRAFGGDPTKVTINGESAGGSSVELHLVADSDKGKNLFRGVIAQSVYRTPLAKPEQRVQQFDVFAQEAGCGTGAVAAQMACLRNASVSALARAQDATSGSTAISPVTGYKLFQPVLDGIVFKDFPTHQFTTGGAFADVPVIVGSTTNETLSGGTSIAAALEAYFPSMTNSSADALVAQYPVADFSNSTALQFQAATGESELLCARHVIASAVSERTNAWTYRYNQPNPTGGSAAVGHAAENWMMFNGINTGFNGTGAFSPMTPTEDAFAAELIAYWLSFVRAQNPNTYKLSRSPEWKQFSRTSKERMVLQQGPGTTTDVSGSFLEVQSVGETQRCEFVASQVGVQQN